MSGEPFRSTTLFIPIETVLSIRGKVNIVRRIGVHEIPGLKRKSFEVAGEKYPVLKRLCVLGKNSCIGNVLVFTKRDVEFPETVEATQPVVPGTIKIIKEGRSFNRLGE